MSRLDDYRTALLAAHPDVADERLVAALDERPTEFSRFVVDMGLGPLWHERTGRAEFHDSRLQAEALYLAQERSLDDIGAALDAAGIDHVAIKGAATRLLLYDNPAVRASFDLDLLVRSADRLEAAETISRLGFAPLPEARSISRELVLARSGTDVDLHWGLLREGRLRKDPTADILARRRRVGSAWVPSSPRCGPARFLRYSGLRIALSPRPRSRQWRERGRLGDAALDRVAGGAARSSQPANTAGRTRAPQVQASLARPVAS
jgi:hypothetical protein